MEISSESFSRSFRITQSGKSEHVVVGKIHLVGTSVNMFSLPDHIDRIAPIPPGFKRGQPEVNVQKIPTPHFDLFVIEYQLVDQEF